MKHLILIISLLASGVMYAHNPFTLTVTEAEGNTYPNGIQTLGNDSNLVQPKGGFKARVINWVHVDTTAANLQRIKNYPGAQIFTSSDNKFRYRNATATAWLESGSSTFYNSNIGSGYRLAVPNTNNIKTVFGAGIITIDSTSNADALTITGTEVDGSTTNELQTISVSGTTSPVVTLSNSGGSFTFVGAGINTFGVAGSTITITGTEVDGSVTNELQTFSGSGTTTPIITLSGGGGTFSITGAGISVASRSGTDITITSTEVDGSISNELQTLANTSNATTHTVTLSNSGGSIQLAEGTNVTLTTSGTALNGIVTINVATPATPTWQQTLIAGSTLTQPNIIDGGGIANQLLFDNVGEESGFVLDEGGGVEHRIWFNGTNPMIQSTTPTQLAVVRTGADYVLLSAQDIGDATYNSQIELDKDEIEIAPHLGELYIDTLNTGAATDSILTWNATTGRVNRRNLTAVGQIYTSNSGLTMTANNTQLGGALLNSPTISGSTSYGVYFTGSYGTGTNPGVINVTQSGTSGYAINATNNGTGGGAINATVSTGQVAVTATATDTYGVQASATSGYAINGTATSGIGVYGASQTGTGGTFVANPSSTNTIVPVININRSSSGTGATGIGGSIDFGLEANDGFNYTSNQIITKWTTGTAASRVSEFSITGVNAAVTSTIFKLAGSGQPTFGKLGIGTFTGTPAYSLSVDASGNVIETSAPLTLTSGRYTPSGGSSSNVNSFGPSVATYLRVGNSVTVSGSVSIDIANCSSSASVNMSLPIATAMSSSNMLAGAANEIDFATASGVCAGDASADQVRITILFCCSCSGSATATFWYTYTYFIE